MAYNSDSNTGSAITTISEWGQQYKEQNIEMSHEESAFDLVSPDDSLLVAGPSRLSSAGSGDDPFYVIGVCQNVQISENSQIQPFKAIGSRRHIFSKTNTPAQISMGRALFYGKNLARALYASITQPFSEENSTHNNKYAQGYDFANSNFLTNLEEDLYRVPFGIGIIYHTPRTAHQNVSSGTIAVGAEFAENCLIQSRNVSIQSQQTIMMEQVQIISDRVVPWDSHKQE